MHEVQVSSASVLENSKFLTYWDFLLFDLFLLECSIITDFAVSSASVWHVFKIGPNWKGRHRHRHRHRHHHRHRHQSVILIIIG